MDINQNNDDLQKAIEGMGAAAEAGKDINMGVPPVPPVDGSMMPPADATAAPAAPAVGGAADFGIPAASTTPAADGTQAPADIAAPAAEPAAFETSTTPADLTAAVDAAAANSASLETPANDPAAPEAAAAPADSLAAPAPDAVATAENITNSNLEDVKKQMMADLFPLMDKIKVEPNQKFKIYKQMIETTDDDSMIPAAYEAAKGIQDETKKAEALLYLIEEADDDDDK